MSVAVKVGKTIIGGGAPVVIQSMTNVKTSDFEQLLKQVQKLYSCGCDIVRLAVSSSSDIEASKRIMQLSDAVLVADIQFDYRLAIESAEAGFKKIRINPGNIGSEDKIREIVAACKYNGTVIRVGSNSGSIEKEAYKRYGSSAKSLAESALENVRILEKCGFYDIVISAKASSVPVMIETNKMLSQLTDYPLHLGVTESGTVASGIIKSAIGIGSLLCEGIGDTIRVSLSSDPIEEVKAAKQILRAVGIDKNYCEIISCPTCSRCNYNLSEVALWLEEYTADITTPLKIAVMGCAVNGPGEAREADFGVAGGEGKAVIFQKGEAKKTVPLEDIYTELKTFLASYRR